jgi:hypothetical protein
VNKICPVPVTIRIRILFDSKMLTSVQLFIKQQFLQNLFDLSAKELYILVAVTFLPKVCDVNVTFINRSLEPFVHVMVYFVNVEFGVFQNLLNKVFEISGCHAFYFLVIQQETFTLGKNPTLIRIGCIYVTSLRVKIMLVNTATNSQMIQVSRQESIVEAY